jgi:hypothetical protein
MGFWSSLWKGITTVGGAVIGFMVGGPVGAVIGAGIGYGTGAAIESLVETMFNPGFDTPEYDINQNQGITVNKQGTNNNIPVIYGERYIGGNRVYVASNGESNEYLYIALVLAEGEINAVKTVYIDDELVWSGTSTHGERYSSTEGKFNGYVDFETFHGTANQSASPLLKQTPGWTTQHKLSGLVYIGFRLRWYKIESTEDQDNTPWRGGIPNITCNLQGMKIADVSTFPDSTTRSTLYDDENRLYTASPVNCLIDYLRNPIYGKGLANDKIDFQAAKNEAIRITKLDDGSTASSDLLQSCNAVVFTDRTLMANVKTFLFNMRSAMPYSQGKFKVSLEDNRSDTSRYGPTAVPSMYINEDQIIGTVSIEAESNKTKYNRVVVTYFGGGTSTQETNETIEYTYPDVGSTLEATYLAEDNNRVNEIKHTLEQHTQDAVAKKYAEIILTKSRYRSKLISLTGDASLQAVEINDIINIHYDGLGIDGNFRIRNIIMNNNYTFTIMAEEHNDLVYAGNPITYASDRRITGGVQTTNSPVYYDIITNIDGTISANYDDPHAFDDLLATEASDNPTQTPRENVENVLDDIGADLYETEAPVAIYTPEISHIDAPNITKIVIEDDPLTDTENTGNYRRITFYFDANSEPLINEVGVYHARYGQGALLRYSYTTNEMAVASGWYSIWHVNTSHEGLYALKFKSPNITSALSNKAYISNYDLVNYATITSVSSEVPDTTPLATPNFSKIEFHDNGGSLEAHLYYDYVDDGRIMQIDLYGSRHGSDPWGRIAFLDYNPTGYTVVPWEVWNAWDWTLKLKYDNSAGYSSSLSSEYSNQIFLLTTDQTDSTIITSAQNQIIIVPEIPLETPVITNIVVSSAINAHNNTLVCNFNVGTDDRIIDADLYLNINGAGTISRFGYTTTDLANGVITYTGDGIHPTIEGFLTVRFITDIQILENAGDPYSSADSNQIWISSSDLLNPPQTVTRDYKPAPSEFIAPVLNDIDILSATGGATPNRIRCNFDTNNDLRIYNTAIFTQINGEGTWIMLREEMGVNTTGVIDKYYWWPDSTNSGALFRLHFLSNNGVYSPGSNQIWVSRDDLLNPPVNISNIFDEPVYTVSTAAPILTNIYIEKSANTYYGQPRTKMTFNFGAYPYNDSAAEIHIYYKRSDGSINEHAYLTSAQQKQATIDGYVVIDNFGQRYEYEFWYVVFYYGSIGMETSNRITITPAEFTDYGTYKT